MEKERLKVFVALAVRERIWIKWQDKFASGLSQIQMTLLYALYRKIKMSNFIECSRQYKNHWEKAKGGKRQNLKYYKDRQWNRKKKNLVIDSDQ